MYGCFIPIQIPFGNNFCNSYETSLSDGFPVKSGWEIVLSALMYSADFVCCMESGRSAVLTTDGEVINRM